MPDVFSSQQNSSSNSAPAVPVVPVDQPVTQTTLTPSPTPAPFGVAPAITRPVDEFSQMMSQTAPAHNPFKAFAAKPFNTFFDSANSQETVLLLLRQHPVTQIHWVVIAVILVFVPFLLAYVNVLGFLPMKFHVVAAVVWYLMVVGFSLESILDWFFNVYIITNERIIDVSFKSLLFKQVSYTEYNRIEDVNFSTSGALGAIFDYGNVLIQTAAAVDQFSFDNIPHPSRVTAFINDLLSEAEAESQARRGN